MAVLNLPFSTDVDTFFRRVIPNEQVEEEDKIEKVVFCTGKIYYELAKVGANYCWVWVGVEGADLVAALAGSPIP